MSVGIWLKYFRHKLFQFEWKQGSVKLQISSVQLYITDQVVFRYFFYKNFAFLFDTGKN